VDFKGYGDGFQLPFWWGSFLNSDQFLRKLNDRWFSLRQNILHTDYVHSMVDSLGNLLSEAQVRNFNRWPILGEYVWPNYFIGTSYDQEIAYLKNWIENRFYWIDANLPQPTNLTDPEFYPQEISLHQNFPNPFNNSTQIEYQVKKAQHIKISILDVSGRSICTLVDDNHSAGRYEVRWDAKNADGFIVSSGIYLITLKTRKAFRANKAILIN